MKPIDAVTTATVALWYALPDYVHSRTARSWLKAGLLTVSVALSSRELQDIGKNESPKQTPGAQRAGAAQVQHATTGWEASDGQQTFGQDAPLIDENFELGLDEPQSRGGSGSLALIGLGAGVASATIGVAVAGEKAMFRLGQYLSTSRGLRFGHTLVGLGAAALTYAGLKFLERLED